MRELRVTRRCVLTARTPRASGHHPPRDELLDSSHLRASRVTLSPPHLVGVDLPLAKIFSPTGFRGRCYLRSIRGEAGCYELPAALLRCGTQRDARMPNTCATSKRMCAWSLAGPDVNSHSSRLASGLNSLTIGPVIVGGVETENSVTGEGTVTRKNVPQIDWWAFPKEARAAVCRDRVKTPMSSAAQRKGPGGPDPWGLRIVVLAAGSRHSNGLRWPDCDARPAKRMSAGSFRPPQRTSARRQGAARDHYC